jgi:hypothetical protein
MTQTLTGLFDHYDDAKRAVERLEAVGIPHSHISIVASNADGAHGEGAATAAGEDAATGAGVGATVGGIGGLLAGLGLLVIPGVGPVVAAGWLGATIIGAIGGGAVGAAAGGLVGGLTHAGVSENDAHVYAEGVRRGGSLVTAKVDDGLVTKAQDILESGNSVDIAERGAAYRQTGWTRFDNTAPAYTSTQVSDERSRFERV